MKIIKNDHRNNTIFWFSLSLITAFDIAYILILYHSNIIEQLYIAITLVFLIELPKSILVKMNYSSFDPKDVFLGIISLLLSILLEISTFCLVIWKKVLFFDKNFLIWTLLWLAISFCSKLAVVIYFYFMILIMVHNYKESLAGEEARRRRT